MIKKKIFYPWTESNKDIWIEENKDKIVVLGEVTRLLKRTRYEKIVLYKEK